MRLVFVSLLGFCVWCCYGGFYGEYFTSSTNTPTNYQSDHNLRFAHLVFEREDSYINFPDWDANDSDWINKYHMPEGFPKNYFAVHWTGVLSIPATGQYTFQTASDDGVRLWIGDTVVIEKWDTHSVRTDTSAPIYLVAGSLVHIRLDFFEYSGGGYITLKWQGPTLSMQLLGDPYVSSIPSGFHGEYFLSSNAQNLSYEARFQTFSFQRKDTYINFPLWEQNWVNYHMPDAFPRDLFAARWTASVHFPFTGSYRFQTISDDGVRVTLNNTVIIENWTTHAPATDTSPWLTMTASTRLPITVEFFEYQGGADLQVKWEGPTMTMQPLGGAYVGRCGNGKLDAADGEECDGGLGCRGCICLAGFKASQSVNCLQICGNGVLDLSDGEECDSGTGCVNCTCSLGFEPTQPFSLNCTPRITCGNRRIDEGEECETGGLGCVDCVCTAGFRPSTPLSTDCQQLCGNGQLDFSAGEECDGGLACRNCKCLQEFEPTYPPSVECQRICGNYHIDNGEECDSGFGCKQCHCTSGFQPLLNKSIDCEQICGNNKVDVHFGEQCDGGTGCSTNCVCQSGFKPKYPAASFCEKAEHSTDSQGDARGMEGWKVFLIMLSFAVLISAIAYTWWRKKRALWRARALAFTPQTFSDLEQDPEGVTYVPMQDYAPMTAQPPPYISEENSRMLNDDDRS